MLLFVVEFLLTVIVVLRIWVHWRKRRSAPAFAVAIGGVAVVYAGLLWLLLGPLASVLQHPTPGQMFAVIAAMGVPCLLGIFELAFRLFDGPFPDVEPARVHRRKIYPWMALAALTLAILIGVRPVVPAKWEENLTIATYVFALAAPMMLWFLHYQARRWDYGRAALVADFWVHWEYRAGELENWTGLDPKAVPETWIGPAGLLWVGDFAPWDLMFYELREATAASQPHPKIVFRFKKTSLGDVTDYETYNVALPVDGAADLPLLQEKLRGCCPSAKISLA